MKVTHIAVMIAAIWLGTIVGKACDANAHDPHPGSFDRKGTDCSVFEGDLWYMCQKVNALSSHVSRMDADLMAHTRAKREVFDGFVPIRPRTQ